MSTVWRMRAVGEFFGFQVIWIARAVLFFVVGTDDGQDVTEALERRADALSDDGVFFHDFRSAASSGPGFSRTSQARRL